MGERTPTAPVRRRRDLRWIAVGVLTICLGGLGAALLYQEFSHTEQVLALARTVHRNQVITESDLVITSAVPAAGVSMVDATDLVEVIGRTALLDLPAGTLLHPTGFGQPPVRSGEVRMGLKLAPGRMPSLGLEPGADLWLVELGREGAGLPSGASVVAELLTEPVELADGTWLMDVSVARGDAERVARLAAAELLSAIGLPKVDP